MKNAIVWADGGTSKYASINLDSGLTAEQVADRVVPDGLSWTLMALSEAAEVCREWIQLSSGERIREERNALLTASDWTQVVDAPVDQAAWATYRQALRDIPQQEGFPTAIAWPTKP